jgi:hypothetical protein
MNEVPQMYEGAMAEQLSQELGAKTVALGKRLLGEESPNRDDLEVVAELLQGVETEEDGSAASLSELKGEMAIRIDLSRREQLEAEIDAEVDGLLQQLEAAEKIADTDLRQAALVRISQAVEALRLQQSLQGFTSREEDLADIQERLGDKLSQALESLATDQAARMVNARMRYQAWALAEIAKMKPFLDKSHVSKELYRLRDESAESEEPVEVPWAEFAGVRRRLEKGIGKLNDNLQLSADQQKKMEDFVQDNWYELFYQIKHDAAARHLLPIDQRLLEPPVARFYSEAFEQVWEQIEDGSGMQLSLAKMTASVPKRSLADFAEENDD